MQVFWVNECEALLLGLAAHAGSSGPREGAGSCTSSPRG